MTRPFHKSTLLRFCTLSIAIFISSCTENTKDPAPQIEKAIANFELSRSEIYLGDTTRLTDQSTGAVAWSWQFEGGNPSSSTEQNPRVVFRGVGTFRVSLVALNSKNEASLAKIQNVTVKDKSTPPYGGTIWIEPNIVISDDPTTYKSITYKGQEKMILVDRRTGTNQPQTVNAFTFTALYEGGKELSVYVNPEFSQEVAETHAIEYARLIGQLPAFLFNGLKLVHINDGVEPWGGGGGLILIHTGQGEQYRKLGIMVETLIHEAGHASLSHLNETPEYLAAAQLDPTYISTYARDNPLREDIAETILLYLAYRYKPKRVSEDLLYNCSQLIPNRIKFFDDQEFEIYPWVK